MRIPRSCVGKYVELTWRDPQGAMRQDVDTAPKGIAALATWIEYGMIDDITEGVVRVVHSFGQTAGSSKPDEMNYTVVPEDLVVKLRVMVESAEGPGA